MGSAINTALSIVAALRDYQRTLVQSHHDRIEGMRASYSGNKIVKPEQLETESKTVSAIVAVLFPIAELGAWALNQCQEDIEKVRGRFGNFAAGYCQSEGIPIQAGQIEQFAFEPFENVRGRLIALSGGRQQQIDRFVPVLAVRHWDMMGFVNGARAIIAQLEQLRQEITRDKQIIGTSMEGLPSHDNDEDAGTEGQTSRCCWMIRIAIVIAVIIALVAAVGSVLS
jgi:hypothetical protein